VGDLYAGALRDPKKAIDAYQGVVRRFPDAPEVQGALAASARLFSDKLRQYDLALEMDERIVDKFPKTKASLDALKDMARLQREHLGRPEKAIDTLRKLSAMHGGQDGVDALLSAADIARRDLKDYQRQADILEQVASDYAASKEAPQALFDAAGVYEKDLQDTPKAVDAYKAVVDKFPDTKLARKAKAKAEKLSGA
ncbi:MAG: tetratricopeptide repeat protein, partial [Elusimicrobia bacterium]|nr:tetratricopeptide repeat protein [Elusimicrobiota bacterium]